MDEDEAKETWDGGCCRLGSEPWIGEGATEAPADEDGGAEALEEGKNEVDEFNEDSIGGGEVELRRRFFELSVGVRQYRVVNAVGHQPAKPKQDQHKVKRQEKGKPIIHNKQNANL